MITHYFSNEQIVPLYFSAIIILCSIFAFIFRKERLSVVLLFLGALTIGYFIANLDDFLLLWDEQYHALVAKNLIEHPLKPMLYINPVLGYDYRDWSGNQVWLHKQPLFLWQMALSIKLFGCSALAVRIPSVILHAILALFIFRIGKITHSSNVGYYGALFFTVAYYPLELVSGRYSTDHNDVAFLFYVTASLWAWFEYQHSNRKYFLILIGIFSGCAVLVKWLVGLLVYAIWIISIGMKDKHNWLKIKSYIPLCYSFVITLFIFVPWQIYILRAFPLESNYEFAYNTKHFFENVEGHAGDFLFHFRALSVIYGEGAAVPYLYLLGFIILLKQISVKTFRVAVFFAVFIVYAFYSVASTKMTAFCLIAAPYAFLGLGALVNSIFKFINEKVKIKHVSSAFSIIVLVVVCGFLIDFYRIQNYHTDWKPHDNHDRAKEIAQMNFINQVNKSLDDKKYVIFNAAIRKNGHIPLMFYTNHIAYPFVPSIDQIEYLHANGYNTAIRDDGNLTEEILSNNKVTKLKF